MVQSGYSSSHTAFIFNRLIGIETSTSWGRLCLCGFPSSQWSLKLTGLVRHGCGAPQLLVVGVFFIPTACAGPGGSAPTRLWKSLCITHSAGSPSRS